MLDNEADNKPQQAPKEEQLVKDIKLEEAQFDHYITTTLKGGVYEMIATFMFVCVIYYCRGDVSKFIFGMWVILVLFGQFSGAHVNPAITLGFYIYEGKWSDGAAKLFLYTLFQFTGAAIGTLISREFFTHAVYVGVPKDSPLMEVMYSELFFTGTFAFVILYVCSSVTSPHKSAGWNCAIIVAWFYMIVNAGSTLSGAAYNPAVLTVLNLFAVKEDSKALHLILFMILAQCIGVIIFAFIFKYCFEAFEKNKKAPAKKVD
jgi:glycerol uptake facilitator-like aquaporin